MLRCPFSLVTSDDDGWKTQRRLSLRIIYLCTAFGCGMVNDMKYVLSLGSWNRLLVRHGNLWEINLTIVTQGRSNDALFTLFSVEIIFA